MKVVIIDYGAGNIQSVDFALQRMGVEAVLSAKEEEIRSADKVILPGVGQAASSMKAMKKSGLDKLVPKLKQDVFGICLGMQLLCSFSEEGNVDLLEIVNSDVKAFTGDMKLPQIGWNTIEISDNPLFQDVKDQSFVYYVNGYFVPQIEETIASTNYGTDFTAALAKDNFYGCQFHPEKSGKTGQKILQNFLEL